MTWRKRTEMVIDRSVDMRWAYVLTLKAASSSVASVGARSVQGPSSACSVSAVPAALSSLLREVDQIGKECKTMAQPPTAVVPRRSRLLDQSGEAPVALQRGHHVLYVRAHTPTCFDRMNGWIHGGG